MQDLFTTEYAESPEKIRSRFNTKYTMVTKEKKGRIYHRVHRDHREN